jgi:hypothetical protein
VSGISFGSFISFSKILEGRTLNTVGGKAHFTVSSVTDNRVVFTVESTGKKRPATRKWLEGVFARYEKMGSLRRR